MVVFLAELFAQGNISPSNAFTAKPNLASGMNSVAVTAVSGGGTKTSNPYSVTISSGSSSVLAYDDNGNLTSDGTNSYSWDAENRLIRITYPGTNNYTDFVFDAFGRNAKIVEVTGGSTTSTKQFVRSNDKRCEERDGGGTLVKRFFMRGQVNVSGGTPSSHFYSKEHLGSIREMTDGSGTIEAEYTFDPLGVKTTISETVPADFQYAGYYFHQRSGLDLTRTRAYSASIGRFISRDPIEENGGLNLYEYVSNNPISRRDPSGMKCGGGPGLLPPDFGMPGTGNGDGSGDGEEPPPPPDHIIPSASEVPPAFLPPWPWPNNHDCNQSIDDCEACCHRASNKCYATCIRAGFSPDYCQRSCDAGEVACKERCAEDPCSCMDGGGRAN